MTETATRTGKPTNENVMALVAYILWSAMWITGLVVLLTSPKTAKFQRWHAIQAIGLGIVWTVVGIIGGVLGAASMWGMVSVRAVDPGVPMVLAILFMVVGLGFIALWIIMMVTAYQGKKVRLPVLAGIADKNA